MFLEGTMDSIIIIIIIIIIITFCRLIILRLLNYVIETVQVIGGRRQFLEGRMQPVSRILASPCEQHSSYEIFFFEQCIVLEWNNWGLGSCDRASWANYEDRKTNKMQQLDVYY